MWPSFVGQGACGLHSVYSSVLGFYFSEHCAGLLLGVEKCNNVTVMCGAKLEFMQTQTGSFFLHLLWLLCG